MKPKEIIRILEQDGWVLRCVRGSHHIYTHPAKPGRLVVPYHNKDMGRGVENAILKQAGLK